MKEFKIKYNLITKIDNKKHYVNNGIQILRMILSYLILQFHYYNIHQTNNKILRFCFSAVFFMFPHFLLFPIIFHIKLLILLNKNNG